VSGNSKRAGSDAAEQRDAADEVGAKASSSAPPSQLISVFCGQAGIDEWDMPWVRLS
jgi:hypothetical protein